jgi:hypothetical protein
MNAKHLIVCLTAVALSLTASSAFAQGGPMSATEEIGPFTVPAGEGFTLYFPNKLDREHPKHLIFRGFFENLDTQLGSAGDFWFDWRDPDGTEHTSPVLPIDLRPLQRLVVGIPGVPDSRRPITFTIPYCPPQVSVHYHNGGRGGPVLVQGRFTHICVPEPSSVALVGLGLAGVGVVALRRRRS